VPAASIICIRGPFTNETYKNNFTVGLDYGITISIRIGIDTLKPGMFVFFEHYMCPTFLYKYKTVD
jgi:hypothetical protein